MTFWTRKSAELPELSDSEDEEEEEEGDRDDETVSESNVEISITGNLIKKTLTGIARLVHVFDLDLTTQILIFPC